MTKTDGYVAVILKFMTCLMRLAYLNACAGDESIAGNVDPSAEYHLIEIDGSSFDVATTI
ncbi:hypothetical protein [Octadecabacter antarcticus]|nr:hypothetical protein [Octadecabacter antarcticus]